MNAPTIAEQREFMQELALNNHKWGLSPLMLGVIDKSLEKLAAIESQPVPVEPDVLRLRNGFFCEPDGSHSPTYGKYVRKNDYDSLQSALQRAQEDAVRERRISSKAEHDLGAALVAKQKAEATNRRMAELMKEPSDAMLDAGGKNVTSNGAEAHIRPTKRIWKAMSAELLKEVGE